MSALIPRDRTLLLLAIVVLSGLCACKPLPDAPRELSELSTYLYRSFEDEDPDVLTAGMNNLASYFEDLNFDQDWDNLAYTVADLTEEDIEGVERPDRDPADCLPVGLVSASNHKPSRQAKVIVLKDQSPVEPNSPEHYKRSFMEPESPACFPDGECELLRTDNDIIKDNALMTIPYTMRKDYRWVDMTVKDGDDELETQGILARSWCDKVAYSEDGDTTVYQSFSIDVFLPRGKSQGIRYMTLWSETDAGVGDDVMQYTLKGGMHQLFEATEEYLDEH